MLPPSLLLFLLCLSVIPPYEYVIAEENILEIISEGVTEDSDLNIPKLISNITITNLPATLTEVKVLNISLLSERPVIFDVKLSSDKFWYGEERYDPMYHPTPAGQMGSANIYLGTQDMITGSIIHNSSIYDIQTDANFVSRIKTIKSSDFPIEADPQLPPGGASNNNTEDRFLAAEDATENDNLPPIDVMVVYTLRTMCHQANKEYPCEDTPENRVPIENRVQLGIEETNAMYEFSGIEGRMRLVRTYLNATYDEVADGNLDFPTIANHLQSDSDGYLDGVHQERVEYGADMVSLWVVEGNYCGYAWTGQRVMSPEWAFAVIQLSCATGYFTFGHEHGHTQGCTHDIDTRLEVDRDPIASIIKGHGFIEEQFRFRTNMAYDEYCEDPGCPKIQRFSNPNATWYNQTIGTEFEDCVWQINRSWRWIASFYNTTEDSTSEQPSEDEPNEPTSGVGAKPIVMSVFLLVQIVALTIRFL